MGPSRLLRSRWTLAGVPLLIAALAFATAALLARDAAERAEREQAEHGAAVRDALARRVEAYTEVLFGVRGFFDATGKPSRSAFRRFVRGQRITSRFPGLRVIGFAERVDREDLASFTADARRDAAAPGLAYPPLTVRSNGRRPELVPISYIEPQRGNERALGLDFLSNAKRRAAVLRTRETGAPAATEPVVLIQDAEETPGFLIMLATPGGGTQFEGVAYAAFRVRDVVRYALSDHRSGDVEIRDAGTVLLDDDRGSDARSGAERGLDLLGRRWRVATRIPDEGGLPAIVPWLVAAGGLMLAGVAALLLRSLTTTEARARELAARMTRDLADSNAELERFAYVASHDLQEPLRSVTGFVGLLGRQYGDRLDERGRGYLTHVERGAARMRALITELLEYSRVQEAQPRPCDLQAAWEQARANLAGAIEEAGAQVTAETLPTVLADPARMAQVLQNLLSNALKYGGRTVHTSARRDGETWQITVRDDGPGIDPRYHDRVFELFERLDARSDVEGTGMGLSICKRVIERSGGRIWVESEPGAGAAFHFTARAV